MNLARKEKMMKWVFQTLAIDRDSIILLLMREVWKLIKK